MRKEFLINIIFLALANLLIKPVYLLWVEVKVNNIVGPSQYGIYASLFSICYIFQLIADPGLLNYNTTYISSNREKLRDRFPSILGLKLVLALVYVAFVFIVVSVSNYGTTAWKIFPWVVANLLMMSMIMFLRSNISGIGKYRWDSFFSILDKSLMIIILCSMIYLGVLGREINIIDFVIGQFLALSISCVSIYFFIAKFKIGLMPKVELKEFLKILKASLPYAWLVFFMTIYTRIDTYMLDLLVNDNSYSAGIYAAAFRLFDALNSFSYLFAVLLLPMFSYLFSKNEKIHALFNSSFRLLLLGITIIGIFLIFYSKEIMQSFYPDDYSETYKIVFSYLILAIIPMSLAYISGSLMTADGRLKELNKIAILGVVFNITLNFFLINKFGAQGAAIATFITQTVMTIIQYYLVLKVFSMKLPIKHAFLFIIFIFIVIIITILTKEYSPLPFYLNIGIGILISLGLAFTLRLIKFKNFKSLLQSKLTFQK